MESIAITLARKTVTVLMGACQTVIAGAARTGFTGRRVIEPVPKTVCKITVFRKVEFVLVDAKQDSPAGDAANGVPMGASIGYVVRIPGRVYMAVTWDYMGSFVKRPASFVWGIATRAQGHVRVVQLEPGENSAGRIAPVIVVLSYREMCAVWRAENVSLDAWMASTATRVKNDAHHIV